jgi:hypothetical protein
VLKRDLLLKHPRRARQLAVSLWILWAIVVWNVVFDRVLVLAGRQYVYTASVAARESGRYLRVGDSMGPAIARGVRLASASALGILAAGFVLIPVAVRRLRVNSVD